MRRLTDTEVLYIKELLHGRQANRGEHVVISGGELIELRQVFDLEHKSRGQKIPPNYRELAIAHALDQGVTTYTTPGVAGGVKAPRPPAEPKGSITDVDHLLMLVGDLDLPEE